MRLSSILAHARQRPVQLARRCFLALTVALLAIVVLVSFGERRSGLAEGAAPANEPGRTTTTAPDGTPARPGQTTPAPPVATFPDTATVAVWWDEAELTGECVGRFGTGQRYVGGCARTVETAFAGLRADDRRGAAVFAGTGVRACQDPYLSFSTLVGLDGSKHLLVQDVAGWWLVDQHGAVLAFSGEESGTPASPISSACLKG